jgi:signal transduction histidine kinase
MATETASPAVLDSGTLSFTIESRILRELGERLVKQPEVAILELIKNAYDADATVCRIAHLPSLIEIDDDGHGMTFERFRDGWMRVGTSSKESSSTTRRFGRVITGEKGIGRFAVRFLGKVLNLETTAFDETRQIVTVLSASFDWPEFDRSEDLGKVRVPYQLRRAAANAATGTVLSITKLRPNATPIDWRKVLTSSLSIVTPYSTLLRPTFGGVAENTDTGFALKLSHEYEGSDEGDLSQSVVDAFVLRALVELDGERLHLRVYRRGASEPSIDIEDHYENALGSVFADIRFFPQRKGTFTGLDVNGTIAKTWVKNNSGVAVFDRNFRVHPYGTEHDDWLQLSSDTARRQREPRSSITRRHLPMDDATRQSTQLNYMLRLPYPQQLVGIVQVIGRRGNEGGSEQDGALYASADREGFVNNSGFRRLNDLIRGAVEAIASADRELQLEQDRSEQEELIIALRQETRAAIAEIKSNANIAEPDKTAIVERFTRTLAIAEQQDERLQQREVDMETMSLLGVVAGFMTHEFGGAFHELEEAQARLVEIAKLDSTFLDASEVIAIHLEQLREFVTYSQGYIRGAATRPKTPFPSAPRIKQVVRVFGKYATDRGIAIDIDVAQDVMAPLIPVSLYNGIALNLFTNSLKAVTAKSGEGDRRILFRAWNDNEVHWLEVCDTGIGIPQVWRQRVFEPLFTTTASNKDPLGSGMGLGLSLVKRGVQAYGGKIAVVEPPPGFTTCFQVKMPLEEDD